ncbi:hypothetical protein SARC_01114 [Sphaeroforma arctica JP610]|uniref:Uncharacterized protein n=1 Tax=Sphaeroforma arctica JP610 TaxID=667725 RepID=A0A0L0GCJ6_9EUKA|nr:hypothetical protein SARC_01114 [Sphaeroforma arctica JP610]KNC86735.1 hypothetical protein SARC_01114 [Sphaeroforma arctica JP610]|eukprot:XP_014160637.1 hypothetical protein SARC_01114 [Sphaeroforma arctica JP610]
MSSNSPTTRLGTEGSKNNPHFGSRLSPNPSPDLSQPNRSMSLTTAKRKYTIPSLEDHNMTAALHEIDSLSSFVPAGKKPVLARVVLTGGM